MRTSKSNNKTIAITMGDPLGIGPEIIAKALRHPQIRKLPAHFHIIGDHTIYQRYEKTLPLNCDFIHIGSKLKNKKSNRLSSAQASLNFLKMGIELIKEQEASAIVTAPVSKESICQIQKNFQGHTEFLADAFSCKDVGMMFVADKMKTILMTRHVALKDVSKMINAKNIYETIKLTNNALKKIFHIKNPTIAVCGLNPHAGEGGTLGSEEIEKIIPAVTKAAKAGIRIRGPLAADSLFTKDKISQFDAVLAMYHDQGLIPIKTLYFRSVVNLTIGLPFIRTSPAHGTAFDIAGKNIADPSSMREAIKLAVQLSA